MTAAANVMQLVRAHFQRDETAFASAAMSLARAAKSNPLRVQITEALKRGYDRRPGEAHNFLQQVPAPRPENMSNLLQSLPAIGFADLLLPVDLQLFLDEIVTEIEYRADLAARKLRPRCRLLFYGPPGNGKTSSAAALGNALGIPAYAVSLPRVIDKYIGATGQHLGELFDSLRANTLIVFDEIDAIGATRGGGTQAASKEMNGIVNTMLTLMDRNRDGIFVATTNRPDIIDPALLRRFDEQIHFPDASFEQMTALAERLCEEHGVPPISVSGCRNFDEATKLVQREARRAVMREILSAEEDDAVPESDEAEAVN